MSELLKKYDEWLNESGPAALVTREHLMAVEGRDGVLFPPTFAASEDKTKGDKKGVYNIDEFPDGKNVCLIDSVGSQANRIEPLFSKKSYAGLVPQVVIKAGEVKVNLLEAGHRAGDAIARCSSLQKELQEAFKAVLNGDCEPLARVAPTSLVFGVWDSRGTQAKLPRLVASTIRAFDVLKLTRSAVYVPATEYVSNGLLEEAADEKTRKAYAKWGFKHVPASGSLGGVIATGGIRREATLHIAALRLLTAGDDEDRTLTLQRYILGLALVAFTCPAYGYLRQGCNLVLDPDNGSEFKTVNFDGKREDIKMSHGEAVDYAKAAAAKFGIAGDREVLFEKELAEQDIGKEESEGGKKSKKTRGKKNK